jgi:hypothetical protein
VGRCGYATKDIARAVDNALRKIPKSWQHEVKELAPEIAAAAHVLTLWFSDPRYLDENGSPRAIPVRGPPPSIETLSLRAAPTVNVQAVLRYLLRRTVLRATKLGYVPRSRVLYVRGSGNPHHWQGFRALVAMLGTLDHNAELQPSTPPWVELSTVNQHVPISEVSGFDQRQRERVNAMLVDTDKDLLACEGRAKLGEPTVSIGVGAYRFEEKVLSPERAASRRRARSK